MTMPQGVSNLGSSSSDEDGPSHAKYAAARASESASGHRLWELFETSAHTIAQLYKSWLIKLIHDAATWV